MKTIIAIDPGGSGGVAWQLATGQVQAVAMPDTRGDCIELLRNRIMKPVGEESCVAYVEKVAPYIPDAGASMMFEFGRNVERVGCILETLGIRIIEITPKEWQRGLMLGASDRIKVPAPGAKLTREEKRKFKEANAEAIKAAKSHNARAKTEWKNKLKADAQRRFPGAPVTLRTCDALLILDFAKQVEASGGVIVPGTKQKPAGDPVETEEELF